MTTPPHDPEAERCLLECFVVWPDRAAAALNGFDPADLYDPGNRRIFRAIQELIAADVRPDYATLVDQLQTDGMPWEDARHAVAELMKGGMSPANVARYCTIISGHARRRDLLDLAEELPLIVERHRDAAKAASALMERVQPIVDATNRGVSLTHLSELLPEHLDVMEARQSGEMEGLRTGLVDLDEILAGIRVGDLVVIGARESVGKSILGLNIAEHVAATQGNALFVSLEMPRIQLLDRIYAKAATVDHSRVYKGRMSTADWERITYSTGKLAESGLYIADNSKMTMTDIGSVARRIPDCKLIVIDYIQLVSPEGGSNREQQVSQMAWAAKLLGRQLGCAVMILAQLNRALDLRADKHPVSADLRESGALAQHADKVLLLYRDELYNPDTEDRGTIEIIVDKNRTGLQKVAVKAAFLGHRATIANMTQE